MSCGGRFGPIFDQLGQQLVHVLRQCRRRPLQDSHNGAIDVRPYGAARHEDALNEVERQALRASGTCRVDAANAAHKVQGGQQQRPRLLADAIVAARHPGAGHLNDLEQVEARIVREPPRKLQNARQSVQPHSLGGMPRLADELGQGQATRGDVKAVLVDDDGLRGELHGPLELTDVGEQLGVAAGVLAKLLATNARLLSGEVACLLVLHGVSNRPHETELRRASAPSASVGDGCNGYT
ncbi:glutamine synthetase [Babesia caballi]|uniref:Glutamine synthetase n=1 Tax=Babesia caballi TaxID=5871 RepID=A0AAV4LWR4_BABCB|nr:glutamine synthetase [Babesia caballi]